MSLDLVAVQRDAALLDALSQRQHIDARHDGDPVVGLLAALVADVDDGLPAGDVAPVIPEQSRRHRREAPVLTLAVPVVQIGRRHTVRALAAFAVAAAVLSVSGVAAAVSGDPLTPYKNVINVVRGGYHDVMPSRSMIAPEPKAKTVTPMAKLAAAKAQRTAKAARDEVSTRSSRGVWRADHGRGFWDRDARHHRAWDRRGWNRHGSDGSNSSRRSSDRHHRQWGDSGQQTSWGDGGGQGGGGTGRDWPDSGGHGDGSGDGRR